MSTHVDADRASGYGRPVTSETPTLEARGLGKTFGRVVALTGVSLKLYPDEVLAIIGRETVDSASGAASLILTEQGRSVGSLGPGLTSYSADAVSGLSCYRFVGRDPDFQAPTGVPV